MENTKENINSAAIAPDETAVMGTVESNNPTNSENNQANNETSVETLPVTTPQMASHESEESPTSNDLVLRVLQCSGYLDNDGQISEKFASIVPLVLRDVDVNLKVQLKPMFLLSDIIKAGFKLCVLCENREVYSNQVDKLYEDVKDSKKCFDEVGKVVPARRVLEEGLGIRDFEGNEVTLKTENLDYCLAVIDGQHRATVCSLHPEIDLWIEFDEYEGSTLNRISLLNNKRKDHTGKDQKHSISVHFKGGVPVIDGITNYQKLFGVTEKYAEAMLTGKVDQFKRDELTDIQIGKKVPGDKYQGDPKKIEAGFDLGYALKLAFEKNNLQWKKVRKYELPLACHQVVAGLQDEEQEGAMHRMAIWVVKMDDGEKAVLTDKIGKEGLQAYITKKFNKFQTEHNKANDWEEIEVEFETAIKQVRENASSTLTATKKLTSGTPWEIIANRRELARKQQEKEAKKSADKASKDEVSSNSNQPNEPTA